MRRVAVQRKRPVGRPVGWRKADARRHSIMIRLNDTERTKLRRLAKLAKRTASDVLRDLLRKKR